MLAFLLSGAIFIYWSVTGFALLLFLSPRPVSPIGRLLLAPAAGLALMVLPAFWISRLGVPVREFAMPLTLLLAAAAVAALAWRRHRDGLDALLPRAMPVLAALGAAMALVGWPLFLHGFQWISVANDDMANYVLAAYRFVDNGYFTMPTADSLVRSTDTAQVYWFMHGLAGVRSGSELALAWLISVTGINGFNLFMPVMVALHAVLIAASIAIIASEAGGERLALAGILILAINPLTAFGTLSQLIGQVGGLALLAASLATLQAPWSYRQSGDLARALLRAGFMLAAFLVWYPEAYPFLGLGAVFYLAINFGHWRRDWRRMALLVGALVVLVFAATGSYFVQSVQYLVSQAVGGAKSVAADDILFPFFLIPSGIPTFWGLQPLAVELSEPWQSLAILFGLVLLPVALAAVVATARRGTLVGSVAAAMTAMMMLLFAHGSDFGLFKIAMYVQPFLVGSLLLYLAGPDPVRSGAGA